MHSLIHHDYARSVAEERVRLASKSRASAGRHRPPPAVRVRAARAAARLAHRLDAESARRAVA